MTAAVHSMPSSALSNTTLANTLAATRLRIVSDEAAFLALEPHWNALLDQNAVRTPFMTWDWVSLWYQLHKHQCSLCVGVLDDAATGRPIAIAPLIIGRPTEGSRKMLRHLTFIGCIGADASQGMDFLVPAGLERSLVPQLARTFRRSMLKWDVIDLQSMHAESPTLPFIKAALASHSAPGERSAPQNSYLMSLPPTWDEQLALWKSKERVIYRSKWRKLMDEHQGRALQGGVDVPAEQAFDELWRVHSMRFEGEKSNFLNDASRSLHRELVRRWTPSGRVMLPLIEADGRIVAARYGFAMDGRYWSFQTGYDPAYGKASVGKLSLGWTAQCAIERGLREIDHLPGEARYKQEWSTHTRRVVHLEAFNHISLTALVFRAVREFNRMRFAGCEPIPSPESEA